MNKRIRRIPESIECRLNYEKISMSIEEEYFKTVVPRNMVDSYIAFHIDIADSSSEDYILLPACCYKGNQFLAKVMEYPSMYEVSEAKVDMPIMVSEVPRLNEDGSGCIAINIGDLSVPCFGLYQENMKKAIFIFLEQEFRGHNIGISYELGKLIVHVPSDRRCNNPNPCIMDEGMSFEAGENVGLRYKWYEFPCEDIMGFYEFFFTHRKCMGMCCEHSRTLNMKEAWDIHEDKYNKFNYNEFLKAYTVGCEYDDSFWGRYQIWQPGWTGGALSTYPLMKLGGSISYQRAIDTLEFLFSTQQESGFFIGLIDGYGNHYGDGFKVEGTKDWHMVRKSADILYFMFKHFEVMKEKGEEIPQQFKEGTLKLAEAFARNWKKYGQLGQFVSHETGDIVVGGSTAGALVAAGFIKVAEWFNIKKYTEYAQEIGEYYYRESTLKGYSVGGPGEIMQNPDSESAFLLLESYIVLYEHTKEEKWLKAARQQAAQCSSWVVAYNYKFPDTAEFGRVGIKTIGSVFANVQNKHSAPGICTLSGDSLYKLYKITGETIYLELITDIAVNIFQYISTNARPLYSRDEPNKPCPQGYINERVNLSDWEGTENVGTIFYGSTWAEVSSMLTITELKELLYENGL